MGWGLETLGNCCEIISGSTPSRSNPKYWGGDILWVTPTNLSSLQGRIIEETKEKITQLGYDNCSTTIIPKGSILFSSRATIGLVAIAGKPLCTNQGFKNLVPGARVHSDYLYWCMRYFTPHLASQAKGAIFKEISKKAISNFAIPLPPLEEQKRLANILNKAEEIREQRLGVITLTEELWRSVFLEFFGDPLTNPKGLPMVKIGDFSQVKTGKTPSRYDSTNYGGNIRWLKTTEVKDNLIEDTQEYLTEKALADMTMFPTNSIIIALYGETRGKTALLKVPCTTNQACAVILPCEKYCSVYLWQVLKLSYERLRSLGRGSAQANLNVGMIKDFLIPLPSLTLQSDFHDISLKIMSQLNSLKQAYQLSDQLVNSLRQRAFKGQL